MSAIKLPANTEAEFGIIGCCLLGGVDTTIQAIETLPGSSAFFNELCQNAMTVLEAMATANKPISPITLLQEWPKFYPGQTLPMDLFNSTEKTPSAKNLEWYVKDVVDCHRRRRVIYAADELMRRAQDPTNDVDALVAEYEDQVGRDETAQPASDGRNCAQILTDALEERFHKKGQRIGLVTGFIDFDEMTDGLQKGEMTVIAGRPSQGKSAIAMNIAERVCFADNRPTLFVSLEMSKRALLMRLLSSMTHIGLRNLRRGDFGDREFRTFTSFMGRIRNRPFWIIDALHGVTMAKLGAMIRGVCRRNKIELVIVDYLQKIQAAQKHEKRTYEVAEVSRTLKALAVQLDAAFLVLAQLNREPDRDKGRLPRMSDLADSGQIERDADTVALLHRDFKTHGAACAKLIVAKQREGETGTINLVFRKELVRFENAAKQEPPYYNPSNA